MIASDDAEKAMEILEKFLEQTPCCSIDDTMAAQKVQKIVHDVKFRHLQLSKFQKVIAKSGNIYRKR